MFIYTLFIVIYTEAKESKKKHCFILKTNRGYLFIIACTGKHNVFQSFGVVVVVLLFLVLFCLQLSLIGATTLVLSHFQLLLSCSNFCSPQNNRKNLHVECYEL